MLLKYSSTYELYIVKKFNSISTRNMYYSIYISIIYIEVHNILICEIKFIYISNSYRFYAFFKRKIRSLR